MKQEHNNIHINTFSKGADIDSEKELLCSQATNGIYVDGRNCMPVSTDGNTGAIEKIKGEEIKYTNSTNVQNYTCICSDSINGDIVEFWAPSTVGFPGIVRVNGTIVLESVDFDIRPEYPLQWDKNESCIGGEIAVTDNRVPPYIFSIKDMVDSLVSDPNKYFSAFDPLLYQINLQSPLDIPVFVELINVGGGGGLPVGHYQYAMRYVSDEGDRTNWSQTTPMIPVVQSLSSESEQYPWVKTYGGPPAPSSKTSFAPKLRFRVTNIYNYDYIEIKRIEYNAGAGIEFTPNGKIVAKIQIANQEISVKEYIDPAESNVDVALSFADETQELVEIERAKAIRYFDKRLVLMNVKIASKTADLTYKDINGKTIFPVIDKINEAGYNDPWNHVYRKSYMRGEKFTFGITLFDGVGTRGFTDSPTSFKNYQFPNRRDEISAETSTYSVNGTVKAATSDADSNVGQTHEVFDHVNAISKANKCDFKNITNDGRLGLTGTKTVGSVTDECAESDPEIENHGARVSAINLVSVSYQPFTPVSDNDPDVKGHDYMVTTQIAKNGPLLPLVDPTPPNADQNGYEPNGFAPEYYAQGAVIPGVENFPKWAKAFSVVRTNAAKRVVCQGLGYYSLVKGAFKLITDASLGGKEYNKFWFYSPDIENGIVSSDTVNDIIDNPQNYQLQFVSPLGFFSEWFNAEDKFSLTNPEKDKCIDMISYVRMLRDGNDPGSPSSQINPFEDASMGVSGGDGFNYIAYDRFRNIGSSSNVFNGHADKGNRVINLNSVKRVAEGRGTYIELETQETIYANQYAGGLTEAEFEDNGLKNWTEPVYMVNIVRIGAEVRDDNITKYKQTGHYQKLESIIGRSNGLSGQKFPLVDERWEDCIPDFSLVDRYIYIKKPDGTIDKWINVYNKTLAQIATIKADILTLGAYSGDVKGVYTHENKYGKSREFEIILNDVDILAPEGSLILVRYDDTAPIRVFGGDTYIGETIFAPIDKESSARDDAAETQFALGIGLPFRQFHLNKRYYTIRKAGAAVNLVQDKEWFALGYIRQLCVMFTVESRCAVHLAHNLTYPNEYFPLTNYVIRPNRWDEDKTLDQNGIHQEYGDDYIDEKDNWSWGGFRFLQQINPDYSTEPRLEFFSRPDFGFEDKTEFCTRVIASLPRAINVQDAPGLKTFPANNAFDISNDQGEIKFAWDATTEKGSNLYAFTEKGICLLLTSKSILTDLNAGEIGYMASDSFIKGQYWLNKDTGMNDEFWRSKAEAFVPMTAGDGSEIRREALFLANKESVFRFMDNNLIDIGRIGYHSKLYKGGLNKVAAGYTTKMTAIYNKYWNQYWLLIQGEGVDKLFVFGQKTEMWYGVNDFRFDSFTVRGNETFGHRDMETWELGKGYLINGQPVVFEVLFGSAPEQFFDKEFTRVRINSSRTDKPTRVEFYKEVGGAVQCALDPSIPTQGSLYLKYYGGHEGFIPRIDASVDAARKRFQQRIIFTKIIHNLATEFKVVDSSVSYKLIK